MRYVIDGPLHKLSVRFVSHKHLKTIERVPKNVELKGLYIESDSRIYINKGLAEEEQLHTLMHEIIHAIDAQTRGMEEEARCDILGSYLMRIFKIGSIKEFLRQD